MERKNVQTALRCEVTVQTCGARLGLRGELNAMDPHLLLARPVLRATDSQVACNLVAM